MRKDFENAETDLLNDEDMDFFKELFESQSSNIVLPESLKAENLSKKYAKEIAEIEKESASENVKEEKHNDNVISIFKKRGLGAIAACVAFAGLLFFTSDYGRGIVANDKAAPEECNEAAEAGEESQSMFASYEEGEIKEKASNDMLDAYAEEKEFSPSEDRGAENFLKAPMSKPESAGALEDPPVENNLFGLNPSTGAVNIKEAARFLIFNGAGDRINTETVDRVMADEMDHANHMDAPSQLYSGFIERLY